MSDSIPLHKSDCALLLGGYQCTCGFYQRQNKTPTALAAEPTKPEPVAWMDRFGSVVLGKGPYETFTTPLYAAPPALAAEPAKPKQEPVAWQERHFFPKVGEWTHWYDCRPRMADYPREQIEQSGVRYQWRPLYAAPPEDVEALRRDAERYRWLREKDGIAVDVTVFGSMEANLDAAIDAAMEDKR